MTASALDQWFAPMLAVRTDERFSDPDWIFEPKLDGERGLAYRHGDVVRLYSRSKRLLNASYPELVERLLLERATDFVLDGEIVAYDGERPSFSRLQRRIGVTDERAARSRNVPVVYVAFDILWLEGRDLRGLPLHERKHLLAAFCTGGGPAVVNDFRWNDGEALFAELCAKGWEGVMAKRADAPYVPRRSRDWLKFKCELRQEFVVGGFTEPRGSRVGFGALLLGVYDGADLRYVGKVGTGFSHELLGALRGVLDTLEEPASPFGVDRVREPAVHWVDPLVVVEVSFAEWTHEDKVRHPRFVGIRRDKEPRDVVRE